MPSLTWHVLAYAALACSSEQTHGRISYALKFHSKYYCVYAYLQQFS
jgi:hypothetical protein